MATDAQYKKLVAEVKKNPGNSEKHYAEASGIPQGQILPLLCKAEVEADPSLKIKATGAAVKKARDEGIRWPRIAARTGKSVAECKKLYEDQTGESASESWTGRGRRHDGTGAAPAKRGGKSAAAAPAGRSGRRGAAAAKSETPKRGGKTAPVGRRGTRAQASGNPK